MTREVSGPERPAILIAERHEDLRQVLTLLLEDEGFSVVAVSEGRAVLPAAASASFHAIVLDLLLPADGLDLVRALREGPARDVPLVATTVTPSDDLAADARAAGCDVVLAKPFDVAGLLRAVSEARRIAARRPRAADPNGR